MRNMAIIGTPPLEIAEGVGDPDGSTLAGVCRKEFSLYNASKLAGPIFSWFIQDKAHSTLSPPNHWIATVCNRAKESGIGSRMGSRCESRSESETGSCRSSEAWSGREYECEVVLQLWDIARLKRESSVRTGEEEIQCDIELPRWGK